jgi:hypothetical protein
MQFGFFSQGVLKLSNRSVRRHHVSCDLNVPSLLCLVPIDTNLISFADNFSGEAKSVFLGKKDVLEVDVSRLSQIVAAFLKTPQYRAVVVVRVRR